MTIADFTHLHWRDTAVEAFPFGRYMLIHNYVNRRAVLRVIRSADREVASEEEAHRIARLLNAALEIDQALGEKGTWFFRRTQHKRHE